MNKSLRPYLLLALSLAAVVGLSFFVGGINNYYQKMILSIGVYMVLATSLNLINGFTGQFSLGHAGFMAVGAYASVVVTTMIAPSLFGDVEGGALGDVILLLGLIGGGIAAGVAGLLVGIPSLRLKGDYLAIVTLGFGEIIRVILQNVDELGRSTGISNIPTYTTFIWIFGTVAVLVFIVENLIRSTYGKGFLAVRDDEIAAEAMGVDTTRYKVIAFVIGSFFAGVAGGLYAHYANTIAPADFSFLRSVEIVVMVILGGMGSTYGVLLAAAILVFLPEWLRDAGAIAIAIPLNMWISWLLSKYVEASVKGKEAHRTVPPGIGITRWLGATLILAVVATHLFFIVRAILVFLPENLHDIVAIVIVVPLALWISWKLSKVVRAIAAALIYAILAIPLYFAAISMEGVNFGEFRMSIYALMLIILMLTRPQGLFGDFHLLSMIRRRLKTRSQGAKPTLEG